MFVFVHSDLYKICFGYFFIILNESYIFMFYNYLLLIVADTEKKIKIRTKLEL